MKRLLILAALILAFTSFVRAQNDPCPTCNKGRESVMTPTHNTEDDYNSYRWRRPHANPFVVRFDASVEVTNNTGKKIKRITWQTDLINSATKAPIRTYTFVTRKAVAPHQVVTLRKKVEAPLEPAMMSSNQIVPVKRGLPNVIQTEQVSRITEIEYADGSVSSP
jgi:hypothetical protein